MTEGQIHRKWLKLEIKRNTKKTSLAGSNCTEVGKGSVNRQKKRTGRNCQKFPAAFTLLSNVDAEEDV